MNIDIPHRHLIFTDESGLKDGQYLLYGGLWLSLKESHKVRNSIQRFQDATGMYRELKWTKVSNAKLDEYKQFVDTFFSHNIRFNCMLVNKHNVDYSYYYSGDRELGFYSFYFQMISRNCSHYTSYNLFLDNMNNRDKNRYNALKLRLNSYFREKRINTECYAVHPVDSKKEPLIQLVDILLGAVGYVWNHSNKDNTGTPKSKLIKHIENRWGYGLSCPTFLENSQKINIWNLRLK